MKKRCFIIIALAILMLFVNTVHVSAVSIAAPDTFEIISEDGERIFRFTPNPNWDLNAIATVYRNTDPPEVIYAVENLTSWAYAWNFIFSEDMQYFVVTPPSFGTNNILMFYGNGALIKAYTREDLVRNRDRYWLEQVRENETIRRSIELDSNYNTLTLTTVDRVTYVFDITTGEILSGETPEEFSQNLTILYISVAIYSAIGIVGIIIFIFVKKRKLTRNND